MTIISSVQEPRDGDFPLEGIPNEEMPLELKAYPPIDDFIAWVQKINWNDLSDRVPNRHSSSPVVCHEVL